MTFQYTYSALKSYKIGILLCKPITSIMHGQLVSKTASRSVNSNANVYIRYVVFKAVYAFDWLRIHNHLCPQ